MNAKNIIGKDGPAWVRTGVVLLGGAFTAGLIWGGTVSGIKANADDIVVLKQDYAKMQKQVSEMQSGVEAIVRKLDIKDEAERLYQERIRREAQEKGYGRP